MAEGTNIGKAYVQIVPSMKGVSKTINNEISNASVGSQSTASKIGYGIGNVIGTGIGLGLKGLAVASGAIVTGMAGATKAVAGLAKESVSAYADYEQLAGGIETLFGEDVARGIINRASGAFASAGLSSNEYMETITGFSASLIQSLGGDTQKASELAHTAIVDMADNANKMGSSMESIQNAYAGFSKQNYTMLDNLKLGYGGTKEEMQRLLDDAEKISGVKFNLDSYADVVQAIHVMQESMGIAGATAEEAESTISGSLGMVKSAWANVLTEFGAGHSEAIAESINDLIYSAEKVIENIVPRIQQILPQIVSGLEQLIQGVMPMIEPLLTETLPVILQAISGVLTAIVEALPTILQALDTIIPMIVDIIVDNLPEIVVAGLKIIVTLAESIIDALPKLLKAVVEICKAVVNAFKEVDWKTVGHNIIEGIKNGLASAWHFIIDWLKQKCGEMISTVKSFFGIHSPSTVFRDQIGVNLALGIGEGFAEEMGAVNKQMEDSVQTQFDIDSTAKLNSSIGAYNTPSDNANNGLAYILEKLDEKLDQFGQMQIVLNNGTLVGELAPAMNVELGRISSREGYR